jgi:dihydroorotate dehydrogenase electron transfer subunit
MTFGLDGQVTEIEAGLAVPERGPRELAPFGRRLCEVSENRAIGEYRLVQVDDPGGPTPHAGQFYMLTAAARWGDSSSGGRPYLPRAFSVCRVRGSRLEFLVDAIGPGTARLARLRPGEGLELVGPLGVGFSMPERLLPSAAETRALLVGGGIGVAPLVIWHETLARASRPAHALLGFRSGAYAPARELVGGGEAHIATDDGSGGEVYRGLVTDLLEGELAPGSETVVYACGPPAMLEAVRRICAEREAPAELALESGMACGFGACFGCVVRTRLGYRRLCVDGPVVDASDLDAGWL